MLILQPALFFRTLSASRSQLWVATAILILGVIGASAVRQQALGGADSSFTASSDSGLSSDISATWTPALIATSKVIANWLFLSLLLLIVSLSKGAAPRYGQNVRLVVWASVPLGIMAALQLLYYASGGSPGKEGLSGLMRALPDFAALPAVSQGILTRLGGYLTLFSLWTVLLVYLGARNVLKGSRLVVAFVIVLWGAWLVMAPVALSSLTTHTSGPLPTVVPIPKAPQAPAQGGQMTF